MKKNKLMRLAGGMLVGVLVTTCAISGSYAKYVTSATGADSARVAKWGVTASVAGGAFSDSYESDTNGVNFNTVAASTTGDKVVAPGTSGTFTGVALTGTPEVAVNIEKTAEVTVSGWMIDHDNKVETADLFYCPIIITVNDTEYNGLDYQNADAFENAVETAIQEGSGKYQANTNLSKIPNMNGDYSWRWDFSKAYNSEIGSKYSIETIDQFDTKLGNLAEAPAISIQVGATVTQID